VCVDVDGLTKRSSAASAASPLERTVRPGTPRSAARRVAISRDVGLGTPNGTTAFVRSFWNRPRAEWKFLPNDAAEGILKRLAKALNVLDEGYVDQGLVVAAPRCVDLSLKPGKDVVVKTNGNASLTWGQRIEGAPLGSAKIVLRLHDSSSYWRLS